MTDFPLEMLILDDIFLKINLLRRFTLQSTNSCEDDRIHNCDTTILDRKYYNHKHSQEVCNIIKG